MATDNDAISSSRIPIFRSSTSVTVFIWDASFRICFAHSVYVARIDSLEWESAKNYTYIDVGTPLSLVDGFC